MERRVFLGAAAALAGLSRADVATADSPSVSTNDGCGRASLPKHDGVFTSIDLGVVDDEDGTLSVTGFAYDEGEESEVQVSLGAGGVSVQSYVPPDEARRLAKELQAAADYAAGGVE